MSKNKQVVYNLIQSEKTSQKKGKKIRSETNNKCEQSNLDKLCTLFVRNLPFNATQDQFEKMFRKFGEIEYALLTLDKKMNYPQGTGFVKFKNHQDAEKVLKLSKKNGQQQVKKGNKINFSIHALSFEGRPLWVSLAVKKTEVETLKNGNKQDKRNVYLLKEGYLSNRNLAESNLSKTEIIRRQNSYEQRKKKLESLNFSVSKVRLSVQNIPSETNEKKLKEMFNETARILRKEKGYKCRYVMPKINQVKIVRDKMRKNTFGEFRSLRFGFVQFREHQDALHVLREYNSTKSLQVEFALENQRIINIPKEQLLLH